MDLGTGTARTQTDWEAKVGEWCVLGARLQLLCGGGQLGVIPVPLWGSLSLVVSPLGVSWLSVFATGWETVVCRAIN